MAKHFNSYPNPASSFVNIHSGLINSKLVLLSLTGKIIAQKYTNGKQVTFNVSNLPSGIYILQKLNKGKLVEVKKIIVE